MYRVLICPNAFKGSLTAPAAAEAIRRGVERAWTSMPGDSRAAEPDLITSLLPLADGGDGFLTTLVAATGGTLFSCRVQGPFGNPVNSMWGRLGGAQADTAVIEMALAAGLALLHPNERDPRRASTYGVGQLIRNAVRAGCRTVVIGIGGSATNDGGAGMACALGARLYDTSGKDLEPGGAALARLARIDLSAVDIPPDVTVLVACDVDNPLCGPQGASAVYGPQKGATPDVVEELDAALSQYAHVLKHQVNADVAEIPGSGAAGGLGAGLLAFCGARIQSGLDLALEMTNFDTRIKECDLAITGEGRLDGQTARGKVVVGVVQRARSAGVPAVALVGSVEQTAERDLRQLGLSSALCILNRPMSVEMAMLEAEALLEGAAEQLMRLIIVGRQSRLPNNH